MGSALPNSGERQKCAPSGTVRSGWCFVGIPRAKGKSISAIATKCPKQSPGRVVYAQRMARRGAGGPVGAAFGRDDRSGWAEDAGMTPRYRLHFAPDNASLVVRLALLELGQPFETVLVDRAARAHKAPAYLAVNPAGRIPALETPHGPIFETGAILLWLADRHGALAPAPESPERGEFLKWLFFTSNTLHAALRMRFYPAQYAGPDSAAQAALSACMQAEVARHLGLIEAAAAAGPAWLCGSDPSALDLYLACLMRWARLYPADEDKAWARPGQWPRLHAMLTRLEARASVAAARRAEGLGQAPFTAPVHPDPPEGSAI